MPNRSDQPHRNRRARRATRKRAPVEPTPSYPRRTTIMDTILPAMLAKRSIDMVRDARAPRTVDLWGLACTDVNIATGVAYTVVDLDSDPVKSPILDAAAALINRLVGRQLWGFGLACWMVGEMFTGNGAVPEEMLRAMAGRPMKDRPTADELCAAMVFDARGRSYNAAKYVHMPELGATSWQDNPLEDSTSIDTRIARFDAGLMSAHVWAAAITQDPTRNRAVIRRLRDHDAV